MNTLIQQSFIDEGYDRVRHHTAPVANTRIDRMTAGALDEVISGGRDRIVERLGELDREWDVDRAVMANFAVLGGTNFVYGLRQYLRTRPFRRPRSGLLTLFGVQIGFLLMHAVVGWCPPAVLFRRLGFRTQREIQVERSVLLDALRSGEEEE